MSTVMYPLVLMSDLDTADANVALAYDKTQTYKVDDHVIYERVLYRCTTAVGTPEEFDEDKWEHLSTDELKQNKLKTVSLTLDKDDWEHTTDEGYTRAYIVGLTDFADDWLSLTDGGTPISQAQGTADATIYRIETAGDYKERFFRWDEDEGEYKEYTDDFFTQSLTVAGLTINTVGTIGMDVTATPSQIEAADDAVLFMSAQGTGYVSITAKGDKPTVDIPIVINM